MWKKYYWDKERHENLELFPHFNREMEQYAIQSGPKQSSYPIFLNKTSKYKKNLILLILN